jgi:predicted metalloprotease with PDZ domain
MKTKITLLRTALIALLFCGCASNKPQAAKKIYERPWIGGSFERVLTPATLRTNAQHFAGHALLVTRAREDSPLAKAGLQEGDVLLTLNGKNIRFEKDLEKSIDRLGFQPLYRNSVSRRPTFR